MTTYHYEPMPSPVRTARTLLWIDLVLMALAAGVLLLTVAALSRSGDTTLGDGVLLILLWQAVVFVATLTLTIKLSSRRRWVRIGLIALMTLNVIGYVFNVFTGAGNLGTFLGLGLSIAVIVCLTKADSKQYLDQ
jgi:hypothetical protein